MQSLFRSLSSARDEEERWPGAINPATHKPNGVFIPTTGNSQLAFSTLACPSWPLDRVLAAARRLGYAGVELRFLEDDDALWARPELTGSGLAATRARLRDDSGTVPVVPVSKPR